MQRRLEAGELTIGRDASCDWQIDDPEKYLSRQHCTVHAEGELFTVTDTSSGGLFIDGADRPLGPGNSVTLEQGMRLRLGDFVLRADLQLADGASAPPAPKRDTSPSEFNFSDRPSYEPSPERPADLPPQFRGTMETGGHADATAAPGSNPAQFQSDDPFSLQPARPHRGAPQGDRPGPEPAGRYFGGFIEPDAQDDRKRESDSPPTTRRDDPFALPISRAVPPDTTAQAARPAATDEALREAFFSGLGVRPDPPGECDPLQEMEELGRRFRALTDGLMQLLRARAQEKQNVRLAQTVIGSAEVNPLKFLPSIGEGVEALVRPRGPGYLLPDAAIAASYRDLADHQARTWVAVQSALRRMIDRFDPASIENELQELGLLETLLAGGRSAKLWQLYEERYKEIAKAAENRFLGEVGADFREAYEQSRGR